MMVKEHGGFGFGYDFCSCRSNCQGSSQEHQVSRLALNPDKFSAPMPSSSSIYICQQPSSEIQASPSSMASVLNSKLWCSESILLYKCSIFKQLALPYLPF